MTERDVARFPFEGKEPVIRCTYQIQGSCAGYAMWTQTPLSPPATLLKVHDARIFYRLDTVAFARHRIEVKAICSFRPDNPLDCVCKLILDDLDGLPLHQPALTDNDSVCGQFSLLLVERPLMSDKEDTYVDIESATDLFEI